MENKKFNLISKEFFTIMYDDGEFHEYGEDDNHSIDIYFETEEEAINYLINVFLPEKEENDRKGKQFCREHPELFASRKKDKRYWKITSLSPSDLDDKYYELQCQGKYNDEVPDERKNPSDNPYLIRIIEREPRNGKEYLDYEESHTTDGGFYIDKVIYKFYKEIKDE